MNLGVNDSLNWKDFRIFCGLLWSFLGIIGLGLRESGWGSVR